MYKKYLNAINELNNVALQLNGKEELKRFSLADERWAKDKHKGRAKKLVKKGEIYQIEFGKNYVPEMSYEHRGLIIGVNKKMLYVLPICSYNEARDEHKNAFHPKDNLNEKSDFYLLKKLEFDFITHDSVLKLNDLRAVSVNRILYQHNGRMNIQGDTYKKIEDLVIQKHFYEFYFKFDKLQKENAKLQKKLTEIQSEKENLEKSNQDYIDEIEKLKKQPPHS